MKLVPETRPALNFYRRQTAWCHIALSPPLGVFLISQFRRVSLSIVLLVSQFRCVPFSIVFLISQFRLVPLSIVCFVSQFRFRILPLFEDSKIDLDVIDDTTVSDIPPRSQSEPQICLSLPKYEKKKKKDTTNPEVHKQAFLKITSRHPNYVQIFTNGSKVNEKVAAAAVSSSNSSWS